MFDGKCSCIYCKEIKSVKGIHTHVDRSHLGSTQYSSGNNGKYKQITENIIRKYYENPKICKYCKTIIIFEKKSNNFCNHSCSASFSNSNRKENGWFPSNETKKRISNSINALNKTKPIRIYQFSCLNCKKVVDTNNKKQQYCNIECRKAFRKTEANKNRTPLAAYRAECSFKFSLNDYPNEFDFSLIEKHGWYSAKNRGNNLTGISRDHMLSVRYGFDNSIDPLIISHLANCKLLVHSDNVSKGIKSTITLEELLIRIKNWEDKYKMGC
jgi:hypothetical protein